MAKSSRYDFTGAAGQTLAGRLDEPAGPVRAYALFAHCFTCSKDTLAAARIARALTKRGIAVLRFDFTGLGASDGDFGNSGFSGNVADLVAAADSLRTTHEAPELLIGHSLGGAAVLAAAHRIAEAKAVATLGAPADPEHVTHLLGDDGIAAIERDGEAEVRIAGRPFRIAKSFLDDLAEQDQGGRIAKLKRALLVCHSPVDDTVGIENATRIFVGAKHPKSFLSLDTADHLLTREADAEYAALSIAAWAQRFLTRGREAAIPVEPVDGKVVVRETRAGNYQQAMALGHHRMLADEPKSVGGDDSGPGPYELLLAGLGACTSMTIRMYADRKKWPVDEVSVTLEHHKIHAQDCADCESKDGKVDEIVRHIRIDAPELDDEQRQRLLEIADRCPVHRTLHSEIKIRTVAVER